jgi:hypothetical protein
MIQRPTARIARFCAIGALFGFATLLLLAAIAGRHTIRSDAGEGGEWFMAMVYLVGAPTSMLISLLPKTVIERLPLIPMFLLLISIPFNGAMIGYICGGVVELMSRVSRR